MRLFRDGRTQQKMPSNLRAPNEKRGKEIIGRQKNPKKSPTWGVVEPWSSPSFTAPQKLWGKNRMHFLGSEESEECPRTHQGLFFNPDYQLTALWRRNRETRKKLGEFQNDCGVGFLRVMIPRKKVLWVSYKQTVQKQFQCCITIFIGRNCTPKKKREAIHH